ncbi:DUF6129 family protein [Corallincola spongiicola]|uniref:DUF6129 domain-containing protein n=1 Tax=Corallincola spongiicola TaxID=2520508 RepID=A0ABY1WU77_9GAMM|nr:DUF6129 family protein [Corallincola spongiicola]TAA48303.1 hypothetical protein EXY25_03470 [Corallincola spongiicola]
MLGTMGGLEAPKVQPNDMLIDATLDERVLQHSLLLLTELGAKDHTLSMLRQAHPDVRFILCSEDDMAERAPFVSQPEFDVFLMAASMGCACFTDDVRHSIGLVIATRENW